MTIADKVERHTPLSAFDRDLLRIKLYADHGRKVFLAAVWCGVGFLFLGTIAVFLYEIDMVSGRLAGLIVGGGALACGLGRWAINAVLAARLSSWLRRNQVLSEDGLEELRAHGAAHPAIQSVLDIWNVQTEELTTGDLALVRQWSKSLKG